MSMGIPPICINQCAEKYLITDNYNGILVKDKDEYRLMMTQMYRYPFMRGSLGQTARNHVLSSLNIGNTLSKLNAVYTSVMKGKPRRMDVGRVFGHTPYEWYKAGLTPGDTTEFTRNLTDATKGSIAQWKKYYPDGFP
jgi:hypothetical protein